MKFVNSFAIVTVLSLGHCVISQDQSELAKTTEKLSSDEAKAIRQAISSRGPLTASPSREQPYPRILIVPKDIEAVYAKKPKATVRLLLKIVEGGEPLASIHASACIHALVSSPEFGWIATHVDRKTWDDSEGDETRREFAFNTCVRLIAEKEKARAEKGNN